MVASLKASRTGSSPAINEPASHCFMEQYYTSVPRLNTKNYRDQLFYFPLDIMQ